jgi:hypothetical protein
MDNYINIFFHDTLKFMLKGHFVSCSENAYENAYENKNVMVKSNICSKGLKLNNKV